MDTPEPSSAAASTSEVSVVSSTLPAATPAAAEPGLAIAVISAKGKQRSWPARLFKPISASEAVKSRPPPLPDLPESYYAPSAVELQAAFAGQVKAREKLTDAPLLTKALRDKEEAAKKKQRIEKWPQTRIRVRFADQTQLQGTFSTATDSLPAIYDFVRHSFREQFRDEPFIIYQTPPRQLFAREDPAFKGKSLLDLGFTPASSFYIKFNREELNQLGPTELFREDLLAVSEEYPIPDPVAEAEPADKGKGTKRTAGEQKLGFGGDKGKVVPAWMKLGNKKAK